MLVMKAVKRSSNLLVDEPRWPLEGRNATCQAHRDSKVPGTPGDLVTQTHGVGPHVANRSFARVRHRREGRGHPEGQGDRICGRHGQQWLAFKVAPPPASRAPRP